MGYVARTTLRRSYRCSENPPAPISYLAFDSSVNIDISTNLVHVVMPFENIDRDRDDALERLERRAVLLLSRIH